MKVLEKKVFNVKGEPVCCDENSSVKVKKGEELLYVIMGKSSPLHWFSMACTMQHENNHPDE